MYATSTGTFETGLHVCSVDRQAKERNLHVASLQRITNILVDYVLYEGNRTMRERRSSM